MISRGRARWAKTERAQWSRDHQTNNTVPTTRNGASCCAPFFFLCRSRFCRFFFFFFFPRPAVLLFHRSRPPRPTATSLPPSSTRCRTRWIYDGFRRDFPGDSAESWTPSPPPETRRIESIARSSVTANTVYTDGGGSTVDPPLDPWKHQVRWQVILFEDSSRGRSLDRRVFIPFRYSLVSTFIFLLFSIRILL